jgi:DNA-binding response OmpR family regulator
MSIIHNKKILIVDDEPDLREILALELEYQQAQIFQASSVAEAKKILESQTFDLIISDIRMPGESGIDLLQHIRGMYKASPPIILITGFADVESYVAYHLGADDLIQKPFSIEKLLNSIDLCLSDINSINQDDSNPQKVRIKFNFSFHEAHQRGDIQFGRRGLSIICTQIQGTLSKDKEYFFQLIYDDRCLDFQAEVKWEMSDHQRNIQRFGLKLKSSNQFMMPYLGNVKTICSIPCA